MQHSCSISIFVNQIAPLAFIPFNLTIFNKSWNWTASHLEQVNRTCDQIFEHMLESRLSLVAFRSKYTVAVDSSSKLLTLLNKYFQHYWDVSKGCSSPRMTKTAFLLSIRTLSFLIRIVDAQKVSQMCSLYMQIDKNWKWKIPARS